MRVFQTLYASSGNAPPQLAVTRRLVDEGHEVLVLGHEASRRRIEATGADVVPFRTVHPDMDSSRPETDPLRDWEVRSPLAAGLRLRDRLYLEPIPGTAGSRRRRWRDFSPDVVVFDFMLLGAGIAAEAAGVPAVALVHCPYLFPTPGVPPYGLGLRWPRTGVGRAFQAAAPRVGARTWRPVTAATNAERAARGLAPVDDWVDQSWVHRAVLVFTAPELDFAGRVHAADERSLRRARLRAERRGVVLAVARRRRPAARRHQPEHDLHAAGGPRPPRARGARRAPRPCAAHGRTGARHLGPDAGAEHGRHPVRAPPLGLPPRVAGGDPRRVGDGQRGALVRRPLVCIPCGRDQPDGARRVEQPCGRHGAQVGLGDAPSYLIAKALADEGLREGVARMADALGVRTAPKWRCVRSRRS